MRVRIPSSTFSPRIPMAEKVVLKTIQCGFESHRGHVCSREKGRSMEDYMIQDFEDLIKQYTLQRDWYMVHLTFKRLGYYLENSYEDRKGLW